MGRRETAARAIRALSLIIFFVIFAPPCSGSFITTDVSGSGTFTFNAPGFLIIDPGQGGNFSGNIFGPAMVIKRGAGLSVFSGGNLSNYTDGTFIEGGTFRVDNGEGSPTGRGPVLVSAGATLEGSGATAGLVTIAPGGILSPGIGAGVFTMRGGVDFQANSILKLELRGAVPDEVFLESGTIKSEGAIVRVVSADLNLTPGKVFTLIDWSHSPTADITADQFSLEPGAVSGFLRVPAGSKRLELVVPEPGTFSIALPMIVLILNRRKR